MIEMSDPPETLVGPKMSGKLVDQVYKHSGSVQRNAP